MYNDILIHVHVLFVLFGILGIGIIYLYCRVGESISAMDRVKCYCRPSWEGVLEMKPYVSDYY